MLCNVTRGFERWSWRAGLGRATSRLVVESGGRGREYSRGDSSQVHPTHWHVLPCCSLGRTQDPARTSWQTAAIVSWRGTAPTGTFGCTTAAATLLIGSAVGASTLYAEKQPFIRSVAGCADVTARTQRQGGNLSAQANCLETTAALPPANKEHKKGVTIHRSSSSLGLISIGSRKSTMCTPLES